MIYYIITYIEKEIHFFQFSLIVCCFICSIILFIFRNDIIGIILGWDGLGVTSFILVIYYNNTNSLNSGLITIWTNRIGDVGLIFLIFLFLKYNFWDINIIRLEEGFNIINLREIIILFFSASTKSAQIPFSAWLPAAIAAPTPVSSLVHSSTLVTAGIFLILRFERIFYNFKFIFFLGSITRFFRALAALFEPDIKKIVALSTLRHLGIIISIIQIRFTLSFSHLIFHAFFKALLFLTIGVIIHVSLNYQDSRKIKNLLTLSYLNSIIQVIAIISLCGIPFLTGYFSKDFFIELITLKYNKIFLMSLNFLICLFSLIYSTKLLLNLINPRFLNIGIFWIIKNNLFTYWSIIVLIFFSIRGGVLLNQYLATNFNLIFIAVQLKLLIFYLIFIFLIKRILLNSKNLKSIFLLKILNLVFLTRELNYTKNFNPKILILSKTFLGSLILSFAKNKILILNLFNNKILIIYYPLILLIFTLNF